MVIGNGMIANEFSAYRLQDEFVIFASGVSDSTHPSPGAFDREKALLTTTIKDNPGKRLAYFSTCSMYDPSAKDSPYVKHKINMEELIMQFHDNYTIFRLSNPIGKTNNTHTVVNFFIKNIQEKIPFQVWKNASRNIIDIDDMYLLCNEILQNNLFQNSIVNIANKRNYPVPQIIDAIEKHFGTKGIFTILDKGNGPRIDTTAADPLFKKFNINFDDQYLTRLFQKYFPV